MASLAVAALVAAVGSTTMSAVSARESGIAKADDIKRQANQAALNATQKQINLRQKMLTSLASQNASAGVGGIGTGGSFGANVGRQITQNTNDILTLNAGESALQQGYSASASSAVATGNIAMGSSLLDAAPNLIKQGAGAYSALTAPPPVTGG